MNNLKPILEAIIFASDIPLDLGKIVEIIQEEGVSRADIKEALIRIQEDYSGRMGGFTLEQVAGGYQFCTRPEMASWVRRLKATRPALLSPAALETLAVVAYRQPVVKSEIDMVRGVDGGGVLKGLLERNLVRIVGRKDVPGKPILYGTTKKFLEVFHLNDLSELPTLREFKELYPEETSEP